MLKISGIQINPHYRNIDDNLNQGIKMAKIAVSKGAELIAFPELWYTGFNETFSDFTFERLLSIAEPYDGELISRFQKFAKNNKVLLVVPFLERESEDVYISSAVIEKNGNLLGVYRKSFPWLIDRKVVTRGSREYEVYDTSVGKLGVLICYDAEFPETSRLLALQGAEIILVPSMWSFQAERRWDIQLPARALDNTLFVFGINTVGGKTCGKSKIVRPNGQVIVESSRYDEDVLIREIDLREIEETRQSIPYIDDFDFKIISNDNL